VNGRTLVKLKKKQAEKNGSITQSAHITHPQRAARKVQLA
jgi:hypothetical protein